MTHLGKRGIRSVFSYVIHQSLKAPQKLLGCPLQQPPRTHCQRLWPGKHELVVERRLQPPRHGLKQHLALRRQVKNILRVHARPQHTELVLHGQGPAPRKAADLDHDIPRL